MCDYRRVEEGYASRAPRRPRPKAKKAGLQARLFKKTFCLPELLDLAFLVHHVLSNDRIVFFEFQLLRGVLFILVGGVEMTRASRGNHANFVARATCHVVSPLNL